MAATGLYNVQRYGATGDGTTDDTVAVQAAFAAAAAATRPGTVHFPVGSYVITDKITVGKNVSICGSGASGRSTASAPSVIKFQPASAKSLFVLDYTIGTDPYRYGGIYQNLEVIGYTNATALFDLQKTAYARIRDCTLRGNSTTNCPEYLIKINDGMLCTFQNLKMSDASVALFDVSRVSAATTQLHFYSCYLTGTETPYAFKCAATSAYLYMHNVEVESCVSGYSLGNTNYVKQYGCVTTLVADGFNFGTGCSLELYGSTVVNCTTACFNGTGSTIKRWGGGATGKDSGVVYTDEAGNTVDEFTTAGVVAQAAPAAIADDDAAITAANLQAKILTMAATAARAPTVPTGTAMNVIVGVGRSIDWSFINTAAGANAITVSVADDHTLVGYMVIGQNQTGRFRTRVSAANTAITYRLA